MTPERQTPMTPRLEAALGELQGLIAARFPGARFAMEPGEDPPGIYLVATVDVADTDEVLDAVGDRLLALQVEEGLPVYVAPLRPAERVVAELRARAATEPRAPLPI
jgi:hypothetical protein